MESALTCIQPSELETAATYIQPSELELAAGKNHQQLQQATAQFPMKIQGSQSKLIMFLKTVEMNVHG